MLIYFYDFVLCPSGQKNSGCVCSARGGLTQPFSFVLPKNSPYTENPKRNNRAAVSSPKFVVGDLW